MNQKISLFDNAFTHKPAGSIEIGEYLEGIKSGKWQDTVLKYRSGKLEKTKLPAVTASGSFSYGTDDQLVEHSGLIAIDIDDKAQTRPINEIAENLKEIPSLYALHKSAGGFGLVAYFRIRKDKHAESFETIQMILANDYGVIVDSSCRNLSRLRFVSYDPDLYLYSKAIVLKEIIKKESRVNENSYDGFVYSGLDIDNIIEQIKRKKLSICPTYHTWLFCGFALASEYGEAGRNYFKVISSFWSGKEKVSVDKQYDICLARGKSGITIKTFFWLAKQGGCDLTSERTKKILLAAKVKHGDKTLTNPKQATIEYLKKVENIKGNDVTEIVEKYNELPDTFKRQSKDDKPLDLLRVFLKSNYQMRFNEITRRVEIDEIEIEDRIFNAIRIRAMDSIGYPVTREILDMILNSDFVAIYNPFHEWFEKNKHIKGEGNIKRLANCFYSPINATDPNFIEYYLERWLLSIVASAYGTHSILIFVITGVQGINKTKFFRELLPEDLRRYYAESKLDEGTDAYILMTKKILIVDDEFGGKTKKEAARLKELSSRDTFSVRAPYGHFSEDLKRLAVLGGTSNNDEVLNDPTGNRRIIPIPVTSIDFEKFDEIDKTDLFMELYHKWREVGNDWFLTKEDIQRLNDFTMDSEQRDPEMELLIDNYEVCEKTDSQAKFYLASTMRSYLEKLSGIRLSQTKFILTLNKANFIRDVKKINKKTCRGYWAICKSELFKTVEEMESEENQKDLPF